MEAQKSAELNAAAVERIKREVEAQAAAEKIWFEDDEKVTLRDGSVRTIPPLLFVDARIFMQKVKSVDINAIILNFAPGADRETDLYDILAMAFKDHKDIVTVEGDTYIPNREYIDRNVDIRLARKIIDTMLDMNSLKK
jgi:hypothetical protein